MLRLFHLPLNRLALAAGWALLSAADLFASNVREPLNEYGRQTWQTENGLPQNTIRSILQSRDGYIWLGTEGGLVRFDGIRFVVFDSENTPGLRSNRINALLEDRGGALWVGTAQGVTRMVKGEFRTYTTTEGLPSDTIWALRLDSSGKIWAETAEGSARFDADRFTQSKSPTGSGNDAGVTCRDQSGRECTGSEHGLTVTDGKTTKKYTVRDGLPSNQITTLLVDRNNALWVGTEGGAARVIDGAIESLPAGDPLGRDAILAIYEDREGNIWMGTDSSGVTTLRRQRFVSYSSREAGLDRQVRCVLQDRRGTIWMGTDGGGLKSFFNQKFSTLTTADGLASNVILSLAEDGNGDLLIGTPDGLNRLHNGALSLRTSADGLADDFVRSIFADEDGSTWVGTRRGLSHIKVDGSTSNYTQANGLGSDLIGALLRGSNGELWIGTLRGLTRFRNGFFRNYTVEDGLSSNVVTDLYKDGSGDLWIATQGGGLDRLRGESLTRYGAKSAIPQTIYGVVEDSDAHLWLAAKNGIFRVNKGDGKQAGEVDVISYGTSDGLRVSECSGGGHPSIWKDRSGAIWFATAKGAAVCRLAEAKSNQDPLPVVIESISIDDRSYDPTRVSKIAPGNSRLSFEYAGLSFSSPQKVQFRYKLEGFDQNWVDAGTRRTAYYTNVPPGHFRFHVIARDNDGFWNERGAAVPIYVEPHYYQMWWFRLLTLALLSLAGYAGYYWRVRQVQAQFNAVLAERNRIAREIHDTLAQGFVAVSVQLEIVSRLLGSSVDSARVQLDQTRMLVRSSLSEARASIWELRSQSSENQDFAARLSNAAKQVAASSSARVELQVHGTYRPLPRTVEDELFRIGQEAVTNAVRHSEAEHITIELVFDTRKLRMTINDDGRGFDGPVDSAGPEGHFGIRGMRERAGQIDGELTVSSERGKGTRVCIEVPAK